MSTESESGIIVDGGAHQVGQTHYRGKTASNQGVNPTFNQQYSFQVHPNNNQTWTIEHLLTVKYLTFQYLFTVIFGGKV